MLFGPFHAPFHKSTNRGRRGIKNRDTKFLDDLPETVRLGPVWSAFVHERGRAVCERPVDNVAMPSNPAHVRSAPVDVRITQVENVFRGEFRSEQITRGRVQNTFRFSSGTARV